MLCPICKIRETYKKEEEINDGYYNGYTFIKTGKKIVKREWWTCTKCVKKFSAEEYNQKIIELLGDNDRQSKLF